MRTGQSESWQRRLHPRLRVLLNSDPIVNATRAEGTGCIAVGPKLAQRAQSLESAVSHEEATAAETRVRNRKVGPGTGDSEVKMNVFILATPEAKLTGRKQGDLTIATVAVNQLEGLANKPGVAFLEFAETLRRPVAERLRSGSTPPRPRLRLAAPVASGAPAAATRVMVGIIDVGGFDWAHPDFLDSKGATRFVAIWDQGSERDGSRFGYRYGRQIDGDRMAAALKDAPKVGVSPHDLEPQSEMAEGSHGTHVASIAAGNSGVAPDCDIAAVLVSLPRKHLKRRQSFYDSTRLIDAVEYLLALAEKRNQPISINVSLGTNGQAHDGSSALDRWLDAWLAKPGRSICVAAGNAGQERGQSEGDIGYIVGRIHASGQVAATGLVHQLEWEVSGNGRIDISENEMEIWYEPQDRFEVSVRPPGGEWIGPVRPGEYLQNYQLADRSMLSVYNERYHPANGLNYISVYLTPFMNESVVVGLTAGQWLVRLRGADIRDGRFHAWIERDDPRRYVGSHFFWPSYFSESSMDDSSTVSSLACGQRIVAVANLDDSSDRINVTSSQGPTRDRRQKPDIAAPGTRIVAANGFGHPDDPWVEMTGTSMASPYVAGVVARMLGVERNLNAAQINGILKATARPLPGGAYEWRNDCGFGVVDVEAALAQAAEVNVRLDVKGKM